MKKKGQAKVSMRQRDEEGALVQQCKVALAYSVKLPQQQARLISFAHICPGAGGDAHRDRAAYTFSISRACRVLLIKGLLNSVPALLSKDKQCGFLLVFT